MHFHVSGWQGKRQIERVVLLRLDLPMVQRMGGCCFWDPFKTPKRGVPSRMDTLRLGFGSMGVNRYGYDF